VKRLGPAAIVLLLAVGLSFVPAMRAKYTNWDDRVYVGAARQPLPVLLTAIVTGHWHPLTMLSLGLDVRLFGMNPTEMHVVNVGLHAIVALLILQLLNELTGSVAGALAGALFFAIHPLRVESVAWVSERKDVLMGVFFAAALLTYLAHRRRGLSIGWTYLLFVLALLAKLTAISLPLALLVIDYYEERRLRIREKIPMFLLSVAGSVGAVAAIRSAGPELTRFHFTFGERVLLAARALVMYLSREIVPANLSAFYVYPSSIGAPEWWSFIAVVVLGAAVLASAARFPRVFAGFAFFFLTLAPMLPLLATGNAFVTDRYTYLPSIGLGLAVALGVMRLSMRTAIAVIVAGGAILGALTWRRCEVWYDAKILWLSVIDYDPTLALAWNNLAHERRTAGDWRGSFAAVDRALELDPCYGTALRNEAAWFDEAQQYALEMRDIEQMLRCDPSDPRGWVLKGELLMKTGHPAEARQCFARAKRLQAYRFR
jgi:tetratricopeptide (TPR) repeat protein